MVFFFSILSLSLSHDCSPKKNHTQSGTPRGTLRLELCFLLGETGGRPGGHLPSLPSVAMLTETDASEPASDDLGGSHGSTGSGSGADAHAHHPSAPPASLDGAWGGGGGGLGYGPLGESAGRLSQTGDGGPHNHYPPPTVAGPHGPSRFAPPRATDGAGTAAAPAGRPPSNRRATHDGSSALSYAPATPPLPAPQGTTALASTYSAAAAAE